MNKKDIKLYVGMFGTMLIIIASATFGTYLNGNKHFHFIPTLICFVFGAFILGYIISNFAEIKNG